MEEETRETGDGAPANGDAGGPPGRKGRGEEEMPPAEPGQAPPTDEGFKVDLASLTEEDVLELLEKARERGEFLDRLQALQAEHENYRKRMARESVNVRLWALRDFALDILPSLDNLERALEAAGSCDEKSVEAVREGIRIVLDMLKNALSRHGAKPIEAAGRQFDPAFHEALGEIPSADVPPGKVAVEVLKGYTLKDIVIRPSRVMVSAAPRKDPPKTE